MSKLFNFYKNNIDKAWYKSSNIVYSECLDPEDDYKELQVVFSNGSRYKYKNVDVNDYLLFREAESQGKALTAYIKSKGYEYEKMDNADLEAIQEEYELCSEGWYTYEMDNGILSVTDCGGDIVFKSDEGSEEVLANGGLELLLSFASSLNIKIRKKQDK